jgi:hypothetical protein
MQRCVCVYANVICMPAGPLRMYTIQNLRQDINNRRVQYHRRSAGLFLFFCADFFFSRELPTRFSGSRWCCRLFAFLVARLLLRSNSRESKTVQLYYTTPSTRNVCRVVCRNGMCMNISPVICRRKEASRENGGINVETHFHWYMTRNNLVCSSNPLSLYTCISLSSYIYYAIYCNTPVTVVKIVRHGRKLACRLRNPPSHDGSSSACDEDNQRAVIIDTHIYIDKREREETLMATRVNWNVVEWLLYACRGMRVVSRETKFRDDMDDDDTVHRPFPMIV